jgi:hypothetical protein
LKILRKVIKETKQDAPSLDEIKSLLSKNVIENKAVKRLAKFTADIDERHKKRAGNLMAAVDNSVKEAYVRTHLGKDYKRVLKDTVDDLLKGVAALVGVESKAVERRLEKNGLVTPKAKKVSQQKGFAVPLDGVGSQYFVVGGLAVKHDLMKSHGKDWLKFVDNSNSCSVVWVFGRAATVDADKRKFEDIKGSADRCRVIQFAAPQLSNADLVNCTYTHTDLDKAVYCRKLVEEHRLPPGKGTTIVVVGPLPHLLAGESEIIVIPDVLPDYFRHVSIEELLERFAMDLQPLSHKKRRPLKRLQFLASVWEEGRCQGNAPFLGSSSVRYHARGCLVMDGREIRLVCRCCRQEIHCRADPSQSGECKGFCLCT